VGTPTPSPKAAATTALILAGGLGTRLRGAVADRPKVLALVKGRPFIEYLLDQIIAAGFKDAILCVGYLADQIEQHLGLKYKSLNISYSREVELRGTAGAIIQALPLVRSDSFLVMNGDSYCDVNLTEFREWHVRKSASISIALTEVDDTSRYGLVEVDNNARVTGFKEKTASSGRGLVNAGIYLLDTEIVAPLPQGQVLSLERDVFPAHLGKNFYGWIAPHQIFIDIGTPESYTSAQGLF
jgi:D-glycero-alpha-D-manno-heptose 1-phosphate guanylyltransferase